ncbi:MAG: hypothetical protein WC489_01560 [Patescibacteria group bacterium]
MNASSFTPLDVEKLKNNYAGKSNFVTAHSIVFYILAAITLLIFAVVLYLAVQKEMKPIGMHPGILFVESNADFFYG